MRRACDATAVLIIPWHDTRSPGGTLLAAPSTHQPSAWSASDMESRVWVTIQSEFSDLGDLSDITQVWVFLLFTLALGMEMTAILSAFLGWAVLAMVRMLEKH
jgi:hypothetical protein